MNSIIDYEDSGLSINRAVLDKRRRFPDKDQRPDHILWGGRKIKTYDWIEVPNSGTVTFEFLSAREEIEQGFDAKLNGWFELEKKEQVSLLRTWKDDRFEDILTYPFHSHDKRMGIWNVYKEHLPNGQVIEDKFGGNAGFWVDVVSGCEWIYHCSPSMLSPPDFEALIFRVKINALT